VAIPVVLEEIEVRLAAHEDGLHVAFSAGVNVYFDGRSQTWTGTWTAEPLATEGEAIDLRELLSNEVLSWVISSREAGRDLLVRPGGPRFRYVADDELAQQFLARLVPLGPQHL
jgi:hypothetical protein